MEKELLSGNEAIARGAYECGVALGVGYPGTPSTETLEELSKFPDLHCEWACNEKVALEIGIGASIGGIRTLVTMKHVGVNVAADPLMSICNTGVNAGLVILAADDPSIYSSQNEQDSRNYAAFARVPMLEPADSAEAFAFTKAAFDISESYDTPVMLRETVRIAHTKTLVACRGARKLQEKKPYEDRIDKYVMMPKAARARRRFVDARTKRLIEFAETSKLNRVEIRSTKYGIVCSGADYQHVREALPDASIFKLGLSWPLPPRALRAFAKKVDALYVVEEACDYFAFQLKALGLSLSACPVKPLPQAGEITPQDIREAFGLECPKHYEAIRDLPARPPALCPGCPHRLVYVALRDMKAIVCGDIGCYTLGASAPLCAVHSTIDMGASLSMAHGMELADIPARTGRPVVGVIGDSTFAHSGITSMLSTVYNRGAGTLCILDNRTTAMTGLQGNPCNGVTLMESSHGLSPLDIKDTHPLDITSLITALGIDDVSLVDSQNLSAIRAALKSAFAAKDSLSVIIFQSPCRLLDRSRAAVPTIRDCHSCGICVKIGCPALGRHPDGRACINAELCIGCTQCAQICPFECIHPDEEA